MSYLHRVLKPKASGQEKSRGRSYFVVNDLSEEELHKKIVGPWRAGQPFTVEGRIIKHRDEVEEIRIAETEQPAQVFVDAFNRKQSAAGICDMATDRRMTPIWGGKDRTDELLFAEIRETAVQDSLWYIRVCRNGHIVNCLSLESRVGVQVDDDSWLRAERFCGRCGSPTITACPKCKQSIGHDESTRPAKPPSFCGQCGGSFPWTEARITAAKDLADEVEQLDAAELEMLKSSLDDLVRDTPRSTLAVTRFKRLVAKTSKPIADGFKDILVDIVSEAIKKQIWPS